MVKIEKNEQYALIKLDTEIFDGSLVADLEKKISGLYREGYSNFIFDFENINVIDSVGISLLKKIDKICNNEHGLLVITTDNETLIEDLDLSKIENLVILPTLEEAVEAIYINELENDFREEEDDSNEFGEEEERIDYD